MASIHLAPTSLAVLLALKAPFFSSTYSSCSSGLASAQAWYSLSYLAKSSLKPCSNSAFLSAESSFQALEARFEPGPSASPGMGFSLT